MLKENVNVFKLYYPDWISNIENATINSGYHTEKTKSGDITISVEKDNKVYLLHSKYHPKHEAAKFLETSIKNEPEVLVIGGIGLGYFVEEAIKMFKRCKIVVCDFDWAVLKIALENRVLSDIFTNQRVHFVFTENPQALIDVLKTFKTNNIQLIIHQPSAKLYPDYYNKLKHAVDNFQNTKEINVNTLNKFQKLWTKNILKNLISFVTHKGVEFLFNQYNEIPCIIVAAGPSLSKNIHLLHEIKGKAIIIAVDTVFQILQAHNIDPDFVIAVDPQDINKKYFDNIDESKAILICEPSISPKIVREYKGKKLMLGSFFHLVEWLESVTKVKGNIEIGGSVATAAYGLAMKMGCDPIIFVGLDLAYSDSQTHMKGAYFEENWFYSWNRFKNIHSLTRDFLKKHGLFNVKSYNNSDVKSDRKFTMFQKWFESQFKKSNRTIIDATEGGAYKENCISLQLKEVINTYIKNLDSKTNKVTNISNLEVDEENSNEKLMKILIELEKVLLAFNKLEIEAHKGKKLSNDLYKLVEHSIKQKKKLPSRVLDIHKQLDNIDIVIMSDTTLNALISITIQNIINEIDEDSDRGLSSIEKENQNLKVAKRSVSLYNSILEAIQFNINQFSKAIFKLKNYLNC